ncbi:MAG: GPW/gp25 family protein [Saprospiraceae bacterium]|nr:GPW/gp25 family protein [Saprospiraceae bacterium]
MIENAETTNFMGRGWGFPPSFNRSSAGVEMLEKEADIASSLEVLTSTALGERVMLPAYGCDLNDLLFESLSTTTKTIVADKIRTAILYFEPRINLLNVNINDDRELEGIVLIEIEYLVRSTNTRYNFVFPFYKFEGTDLNIVADFKPVTG